jgi:hypothetical protein
LGGGSTQKNKQPRDIDQRRREPASMEWPDRTVAADRAPRGVRQPTSWLPFSGFPSPAYLLWLTFLGITSGTTCPPARAHPGFSNCLPGTGVNRRAATRTQVPSRTGGVGPAPARRDHRARTPCAHVRSQPSVRNGPGVQRPQNFRALRHPQGGELCTRGNKDLRGRPVRLRLASFPADALPRKNEDARTAVSL